MEVNAEGGGAAFRLGTTSLLLSIIAGNTGKTDPTRIEGTSKQADEVPLLILSSWM